MDNRHAQQVTRLWGNKKQQRTIDAQFMHQEVSTCRVYRITGFCEYYDAQFMHQVVSTCRAYMTTGFCE